MHFVLLVLFLKKLYHIYSTCWSFAPVLVALHSGGTVVLRCAYFSEELEQWITDGVAMETVQDGHSVVCSTSHLTAFSVIAYDSQPESLSLCTGLCVCVCVCLMARSPDWTL